MKKTIGLLINPFAGIGGRVGLKGSDGEEIRDRAFSLGAVSEVSDRAATAIAELLPLRDSLRILTCSGKMGEDTLKGFDLLPEVIFPARARSTREDTIVCAKEMKKAGAELILFAGGDGTARDMMEAVGCEVIALGIPAGVKIHSAVYAKTPKLAGLTARHYLSSSPVELKEAEVMDIDENAFREGRVSAKLFGYLRVPYESANMQGLKSPCPESEGQSLLGIAQQAAEQMQTSVYYVIGPGTTTREVMRVLGLPNTLLGVDVVLDKTLVASDVSEKELCDIVRGNPFQIIVTPIGGQGVILGRGNQQISPKVLSLCGKENLIVISTKEKINEIRSKTLCVDTGDESVNEAFRGYYRVISSYKEEIIIKCT